VRRHLPQPPSQRSRGVRQTHTSLDVETRVLPSQNTDTRMRTLKIIEHISQDSVIQVSGDDGDFPE
jgi:hypothetical protein